MELRHILAFIMLAPMEALACSPCRTMVFASVFDAHFTLRLLLIIFPVLLLVGFAAWLYRTHERVRRHADQP